MLRFADHLEESLQNGEPMGSIKQHFTLFKELPTICSILRKSFELEETQLQALNRMEQRNIQRRHASMTQQKKKGATTREDTSFADRVKNRAAQAGEPKTAQSKKFLEEEKKDATAMLA